MSDKERLEMIKGIQKRIKECQEKGRNVSNLHSDYVDWLIEQAEHKQKLLERLNKRGIEIRKLKSQLSRCRRKIKKLDWNLFVTKGTAEEAIRANSSNYELVNKLEEENKRLREALEHIERIQSVDVAQQIARQALEGENND